MSVANLTRYEPNFDELNTFSMQPTTDTVDVYVKFEEAVEASSNSLQQLKAEIAALVDGHIHSASMEGNSDYLTLVQALRQLSAV